MRSLAHMASWNQLNAKDPEPAKETAAEAKDKGTKKGKKKARKSIRRTRYVFLHASRKSARYASYFMPEPAAEIRVMGMEGVVRPSPGASCA